MPDERTHSCLHAHIPSVADGELLLCDRAGWRRRAERTVRDRLPRTSSGTASRRHGRPLRRRAAGASGAGAADRASSRCGWRPITGRSKHDAVICLRAPRGADSWLFATVYIVIVMYMCADKGRGLTLMASLTREAGAPVYKMSAHNGTEVSLVDACSASLPSTAGHMRAATCSRPRPP